MSAANRGSAAARGRKRSREVDDDISSFSALPPSSRKLVRNQVFTFTDANSSSILTSCASSGRR